MRSRFTSRRRRAGERGFTLAELMVVIGIVSLLASVAVPLFTQQVRSSNATVARVEARNASTSIQTMMLQVRTIGTGMTLSSTVTAGRITQLTLNNPGGTPTSVALPVVVTAGVTLDATETQNNKIRSQYDYCVAMAYNGRTSYQSVNGPMSACDGGQVLTPGASGQGYDTSRYQAIPVFLSTTVPASAAWSGCAFGGGTFACVENGGTRVVTSPDGAAWTQRTIPSGTWTGVSYGGGMFVAYGAAGTSQIATSTDGITWVAQVVAGAATWTGATYGSGAWVLVSSSTAYAVSKTGLGAWTTGVTGLANNSAVTFGNGTFVAVGTGASSAVGTYSGTVVSWTSRALPSAQTWASVSYGNSLFVATYSGGVARSADFGVSWTGSALAAGFTGVAYGGAQFLLAGPGSSTIGYTSANGTTWTPVTLSTTAQQWSTPAYGANAWVTLGQGSAVGIVGV